ncbi:anti-sigma factor family protein [Actinopolyspora mortivallis]|nr:zf-HC2 domain-containing protein [Actinopolyspora mortivallis]
MTGLRGRGMSEQHLALDALVAFVDGELSPGACDRAAAHLATCPSCAAEAESQRQARSAVRTAAAPSISPQLLRSLRSIPSTAELPEQPDNLALSEDGRLVTTNRPGERTGSSPLGGTITPLGEGRGSPEASQHTPLTTGNQHSRLGGRRAKQGAGVVFSGLVLGALAFMHTPADGTRGPVTTVPDQAPRGGSVEEASIPTDPPSAHDDTASVTPTSTGLPSESARQEEPLPTSAEAR